MRLWQLNVNVMYILYPAKFAVGSSKSKELLALIIYHYNVMFGLHVSYTRSTLVTLENRNTLK